MFFCQQTKCVGVNYKPIYTICTSLSSEKRARKIFFSYISLIRLYPIHWVAHPSLYAIYVQEAQQQQHQISAMGSASAVYGTIQQTSNKIQRKGSKIQQLVGVLNFSKSLDIHIKFSRPWTDEANIIFFPCITASLISTTRSSSAPERPLFLALQQLLLPPLG
jgi:hypothetical protein